MEETVVVGDKGELKNVVVSIKKEEGQDLTGDVPKDPRRPSTRKAACTSPTSPP